MSKLDVIKTEETPKVVTLEELIKRAAVKKKLIKATKQLYVESLEGVITIEEPDREMCLECLEAESDTEADLNIVYNCVVNPSLKSAELQSAYGVVRPLEIVDKIFKPGEISKISEACLRLAGYIGSVKAVEDIKN